MRTLEEFRDYVKGVVEEIGAEFTEPDDDWMQVACFDTPGGVVVAGLDNELFANGQSKDKMAFMLKKMMPLMGATNYAVLFNAHAKMDMSKEEFEQVRREQKRVEEMEGAHELLLLIYGNAQMEMAISADITRDGEHPPTLEEWKSVDGMGGRFSNLNEELRSTPSTI